jgi:hypothetical protein
MDNIFYFIFSPDVLVQWSTPEFQLPLEQAACPIHIRNTRFDISDARNFMPSFPEPIRLVSTHYRATLIKKNVTIAIVMDD